MNRHHQEILKEIESEAERNPRHSNQHSEEYNGTKHLHYPLDSGQRKEIVKAWINNQQDISIDELLNLFDSLYKGKSYDEKSVAGRLLQHLSELRRKIDPSHLDNWLNELEGWAEVDSLCQSKFDADDFLSDLSHWEELIKRLAKSKNINKRRASLVLLTKPIRDSDDIRLAKLAFETIDKFKSEKEILITKAISWLLRDLIKNHRHLVESYLEKNLATLPKIAVRETRNKLLTERK